MKKLLTNHAGIFSVIIILLVLFFSVTAYSPSFIYAGDPCDCVQSGEGTGWEPFDIDCSGHSCTTCMETGDNSKSCY